MTLVKWKMPSANGHKNNQLIYTSPLFGLFNSFLGDEAGGRESTRFSPPVNLSEDQEKYHLELAVPGFEKSDFKIEFQNGKLCVTGKQTTEAESDAKMYTYREFSNSLFQRHFTLTEEIDEENTSAEYRNGILKISLPKLHTTKHNRREIPVS